MIARGRFAALLLGAFALTSGCRGHEEAGHAFGAIQRTDVVTSLACAGGVSCSRSNGAVTLTSTAPVYLANVAALAALSSAALTEGQVAYVATYRAYFDLQASTATVVANQIVAASGASGYRWIRRMQRNPTWEVQTAWVVDPANSTGLASDEGTGADATHPLLTYAEHARRLDSAVIPASVAVSVLSNSAETSTVYTAVMATGAVMTYTGALTAIYTGTITTFTAAAAAPAADEEKMADTAVPVSFTASGMLANAILFKRTNSTAAYWWGAKDLTAKTMRISRATTTAGADITLANSDAYAANSMVKIGQLRFINIQRNDAVILQFFEDTAAIANLNTAPIRYICCWHSAANFLYGTAHINCAWSANLTYRSFNSLTLTLFTAGLVRGVTLTLTGSGGAIQWTSRATLQGGRINANGGVDLQFVGDLAIYDRTTTPALLADYWSFVFFQNGAISGLGAGNTAAVVVQVLKWSSMAHMAAVLCVAGSFNSATPIQIGATVHAVADLPVFDSTHQIGIYRTE